MPHTSRTSSFWCQERAEDDGELLGYELAGRISAGFPADRSYGHSHQPKTLYQTLRNKAVCPEEAEFTSEYPALFPHIAVSTVVLKLKSILFSSRFQGYLQDMAASDHPQGWVTITSHFIFQGGSCITCNYFSPPPPPQPLFPSGSSNHDECFLFCVITKALFF